MFVISAEGLNTIISMAFFLMSFFIRYLEYRAICLLRFGALHRVSPERTGFDYLSRRRNRSVFGSSDKHPLFFSEPIYLRDETWPHRGLFTLFNSRL